MRNIKVKVYPSKSELKKEDVSENISNDEEAKTDSEPADEKVSETSETEASKEDEK